MKTLKPCGTPAAYKRHCKRGEKPCDPCREAHSQDKRQKRRRKVKEKPPCGTTRAYRRHYTIGEPPCQACRDARKEADRIYRLKKKIENGAIEVVPKYILLDEELVVCSRCGYRELMFSGEEARIKAKKHKCN